MDLIECKSAEEICIITENIEKYLLINDYENAFIIFLLHIKRLNNLDRDELIRYFYRHFRIKCPAIKLYQNQQSKTQ
jgi:hypothetical protein